MRKVRRSLSIVLVFVLLASACGHDDDSAADTTTPPVATTGDNGGDLGDVGDLPAVLSSNDCFAAASALGSAFSGGITPGGTFDPEGIADAFRRVSQLVPSEIQDDVAVMADGLGLFFSTLEEHNVDLGDPASLGAPGVAEAMEDASEALESTDFQEASDNVNAWFENMCGGVNG